MTQRFEKAYNSLYNAFMNDTLVKGDCIGCAVGNIVADAMDAKIYNNEEGRLICTKNNVFWNQLFVTSLLSVSKTPIGETKSSFGQAEYYKMEWDDVNRERIGNLCDYLENLTGYDVSEMALIENVFEKNTKIPSIFYSQYTKKEIMEDQFNGLMAVMDVLIELDEVKEGKQYKNSFRNKFIQETNLI
jgi:hypothetical protein